MLTVHPVVFLQAMPVPLAAGTAGGRPPAFGPSAGRDPTTARQPAGAKRVKVPMTLRNPENCDYLAIVSEWSSTTRQGGVVGNAYPILNLAFGEAVAAAQEEFPNPGAVFLMNRGSLKTWDFISLRPRQNERYKDASERDCYFIPARQPELITSPSQLERVAVILDAPSFDLEGTARQILTPRHNVTPYFFVQKNQTIYGPLVRVLTQLSPMEDIQRID